MPKDSEAGAPDPNKMQPLRSTASVTEALSEAHREANATLAEVEAISAVHLKGLLADGSVFLVEHLDDPELTAADRDRLLSTLHAQRRTPTPKRSKRTWPSWSARRIRRVIFASTLLGLLLGLPLRNTTEFAVVNARYSVQRTMPNGEIQMRSLQPGDILYVRRWLRRTPVAVWWDENTYAYASAPVPRSGIEFPRFPHLDGWT